MPDQQIHNLSRLRIHIGIPTESRPVAGEFVVACKALPGANQTQKTLYAAVCECVSREVVVNPDKHPS